MEGWLTFYELRPGKLANFELGRAKIYQQSMFEFRGAKVTEDLRLMLKRKRSTGLNLDYQNFLNRRTA